MATGEEFRQNVLVFDETEDQKYAKAASQGINMVGGNAMPFDDPEIALEDFDHTVKALVTTVAPLSTEPVLEVPAGPSALIRRAYKMHVPLGVITMQQSARSLVRPNGSDSIFDSYPGRIDLLPGQVSRWLGKLGVRNFPPELRKNGDGQRSVQEGAHAITAGSLLGGEARMRLGIWIANMDTGVGVINAPNLATLTGLPPAATAKTLQLFCTWGLLERADKPQGTKVVNYNRLDSPFWGIYVAAEKAIDELNSKKDAPK